MACAGVEADVRKIFKNDYAKANSKFYIFSFSLSSSASHYAFMEEKRISLKPQSVMLKSRYRDKQTIVADIIRSTYNNGKGVRKTNILQKANLSTAMLNRYLDILMQRGYILNEGCYYKPTKKGLVFLESYESELITMRYKL